MLHVDVKNYQLKQKMHQRASGTATRVAAIFELFHFFPPVGLLLPFETSLVSISSSTFFLLLRFDQKIQ